MRVGCAPGQAVRLSVGVWKERRERRDDAGHPSDWASQRVSAIPPLSSSTSEISSSWVSIVGLLLRVGVLLILQYERTLPVRSPHLSSKTSLQEKVYLSRSQPATEYMVLVFHADYLLNRVVSRLLQRSVVATRFHHPIGDFAGPWLRHRESAWAKWRFEVNSGREGQLHSSNI